jgi:hypothetical protein
MSSPTLYQGDTVLLFGNSSNNVFGFDSALRGQDAANVYNSLRVQACRPAFGAEIRPPSIDSPYNCTVLEAGLMHTLHLRKGCFTGNEIVTKTINTNAVRRQLRYIEFKLPASVTNVIQSGVVYFSEEGTDPSVVGQLTSIEPIYDHLDNTGHAGDASLRMRAYGAMGLVRSKFLSTRSIESGGGMIDDSTIPVRLELKVPLTPSKDVGIGEISVLQVDGLMQLKAASFPSYAVADAAAPPPSKVEHKGTSITTSTAAMLDAALPSKPNSSISLDQTTKPSEPDAATAEQIRKAEKLRANMLKIEAMKKKKL